MPKSLTRRSAIPYLFAAVSAPALVATAPRFAAAAVGEGQPVPQGYGQCSQCRCQGYSGSQHVCQNCGHNYQAHW